MSLFLGKYRRTCLQTKKPHKIGAFFIFYRKQQEVPSVAWWNGKEWLYHKGGPRCTFGNFQHMHGVQYFAPINEKNK